MRAGEARNSQSVMVRHCLALGGCNRLRAELALFYPPQYEVERRGTTSQTCRCLKFVILLVFIMMLQREGEGGKWSCNRDNYLNNVRCLPIFPDCLIHKVVTYPPPVPFLPRQLCLNDTNLSKFHAVIVYRAETAEKGGGAGGYYIRDLGSRNGTFVDDRRISAAKQVCLFVCLFVCLQRPLPGVQTKGLRLGLMGAQTKKFMLRL